MIDDNLCGFDSLPATIWNESGNYLLIMQFIASQTGKTNRALLYGKRVGYTGNAKLAVYANSETQVMGDTVNTAGNRAAATIYMYKYTAVETALMTSIQVYLNVVTNIKVALYADNAGEPGTLLSPQSGNWPITGNVIIPGWNTIPLLTPIDVVQGTVYWIAFITDQAAVSYGTTTVTRVTKAASFAGFVWPNPAGSEYYSGTGHAALVGMSILPGALLSANSVGAPVAGGKWNEVEIQPLSIVAGTKYWLVFIADITMITCSPVPGYYSNKYLKATTYAGYTFPETLSVVEMITEPGYPNLVFLADIILITPYCAINGHDFSSIIRAEGVSSSGGAIKVDEIQVPGRKWADVRERGRQPKKYRILAISTDRDEIETFLEEVNIAPVDSEFYPFDAARFGLIASAWAAIKTVQVAGGGMNFYELEAEITCREAWLCGPDKGLAYAANVALPAVSAVITNDGHERAPISLLQASGGYVSSAYVQNLSVRITPGTSSAEHDRELLLCDKLLRDDLFEFGWRRKEVIHSWEADLTKTWQELSLDVHGKVSGGSIAADILTIDNGDYIMIPFYGPLPMSGSNGAAYLDLQVTALTGDGATCQVAMLTDLSDMVEVEHDDLVVGLNRIYVPDMEGVGHVAIGLKAAAAGSVSLSGLKGTVKRCVAPAQIPWSDPDESFKIRVESTAGTLLESLVVEYNDRYWY